MGIRKVTVFLVICFCSLIMTAPARRPSPNKEVAISNFQFTPKTITIKAGATVTWTNKEGNHTVTADDNSWESPTLNPGKTFAHQFAKPGTYPYHCSFHGSPGGNMSGVVKVVR